MNNSIGCNVDTCKYNDIGNRACTLSKIEVVKNTNNPSHSEGTDCGSFSAK